MFQAVGFFCRALWHHAEFFGKGQVWIAALVRLKHVLIAGHERGDCKLLLLPVNVRHRFSRPRANQGAQSLRQSEDIGALRTDSSRLRLAGGRLVAASD